MGTKMESLTSRTRVFISYSHKDKEFLERLQVHLTPLVRNEIIDYWDDTKITTSAKWHDEIDMAIKSAQIAILLVSADFLASDFIANNELPPLLTSAANDGLKIMSVILKPCRFEEETKISQFHAVNQPSNPIIDMSEGNSEKTWVKLTRDIETVLKKNKTTDTIAEENINNVPFPSNQFFVGRDELIKTIHEQFKSSGIIALTGMGGIGKTRLAIEYFYQYQESFKKVLWTNANSELSLQDGFCEIAKVIKLPVAGDKDVNTIVDSVKHWLFSNQDWLLILDNLDDLNLIHKYIPLNPKGKVLVTTLKNATGSVAYNLPIYKIELDAAILLLMKRAKLTQQSSVDKSIPDYESAKQIVLELDCLPLALDQAGAYIEETNCGLEGYYQLYQQIGKRLRAKRGDIAPDHPESVSQTVTLSFEKIKETNVSASELLIICSFFSSLNIPEEFFKEGSNSLGDNIRLLINTPGCFDEAVAEINKYSLLTRNSRNKSFDIHRIVQDVIKDVLSDVDKKIWIERIINTFSNLFPEVKYENWLKCERLVSHTDAIIHLINSYQIISAEAGNILNRTGQYLTVRGQYSNVETILLKSIDIYEQVFEKIHPIVATCLNNLADVYYDQGHFNQAEPLYARAYEIRKLCFNNKHPDIAESLNNLAVVYQAKGHYLKAEPLLLEALEIYKQYFGDDHLNVGTTLYFLAGLYLDQGYYRKAEPLFERSLEIKKRHLGEVHPDVASGLNNFAELYLSQGNYTKAEQLYKAALEICKFCLGDNHPNIAANMNNLAVLYRRIGDFDKAAQLYEKALDIWKKCFGNNHLCVATGLNNQGELYKDQGEYAKAKSQIERALEIREYFLGEDHPDIANSLSNLASLYQLQGDYDLAEQLIEKALAIRKKCFGDNHPDVASCLNNLAYIYKKRKNYKKAILLLNESVEINKKIFGGNHIYIAHSLNALIDIHLTRGNFILAEQLQDRVLKISEIVYGINDKELIPILNRQAYILKQTGKAKMASEINKRVVHLSNQ